MPHNVTKYMSKLLVICTSIMRPKNLSIYVRNKYIYKNLTCEKFFNFKKLDYHEDFASECPLHIILGRPHDNLNKYIRNLYLHLLMRT